jgi:hypothetical protein
LHIIWPDSRRFRRIACRSGLVEAVDVPVHVTGVEVAIQVKGGLVSAARSAASGTPARTPAVTTCELAKAQTASGREHQGDEPMPTEPRECCSSRLR